MAIAKNRIPWTQKWEETGEKNMGVKLILKLLKMRFGEIPEWVMLKVAESTVKDIDLWSENIEHATTLEDVFK